ncbi:MAG TPA: SMP-30/gluconolactonase/LRE family protein [Sediminibacterium sp.]
MKHITAFALLLVVVSAGCQTTPRQTYPVTGYVERIDPALDAIVSPDARAEIIATGFDWSEGPLWVEKYHMLLFSDVPQNTIFKWTETRGKEIYLTPSGYTDTIKRGGETGSNGLTLDAEGNLILTQCGNRQIARMNAPLDAPRPVFTSLANRYDGKRFNSPNDIVMNSKGEIFFTDPPYGLEKYMSDPKKETPYQGVYKVSTAGEVTLLIDSLSRPNGIAFFPGEKTILIANSDPAKANWYAYDIAANGTLTNGRIFQTAKGADKSLKGSPDGCKIDRHGNVFASAPGGIWIFNKEGKLLGKLRIDGNPVSNCSFSEDQKTLYATSDMNILRFRLLP